MRIRDGLTTAIPLLRLLIRSRILTAEGEEWIAHPAAPLLEAAQGSALVLCGARAVKAGPRVLQLNLHGSDPNVRMRIHVLAQRVKGAHGSVSDMSEDTGDGDRIRCDHRIDPQNRQERFV